MQGKNKAQLVKEVARDEGFRSKPYHCSAGILTIGYGLNLEDGITREEAEILLDIRLNKAIKEAESFDWYAKLSPARKRVIVNMIYNIGKPSFKKFKKTIAFIKAGNYQAASVEMLDSLWARQVGVRAKRLSDLMREG